MEDLYFKLTEKDLNLLQGKNLITQIQKEQLINQSKKRIPGQFDRNPFYIWLNKSETVRLSSIHFYGGEHFGEPYYWIAEIQSFTTNSHFSRWLNRYGLRYSIMTY